MLLRLKTLFSTKRFSFRLRARVKKEHKKLFLVSLFEIEDFRIRKRASGVFVGVRRVPREPLLVELDDDLRTLRVGQDGRDEVRFVRAFPLDQEHELAVDGVRRGDDLLRLK